MRKELEIRIASVVESLRKIAGPRVERNLKQEQDLALEEAALEGAITVMDKLEELLGVPANTNAKKELAEKIKLFLLSK